MINFSMNGVKNTFLSASLINVSLKFFLNKKHTPELEETTDIQIEAQEPITNRDRKTPLWSSDLSHIDSIEDDIIVYLFIQKDPEHSEWNLISPVILEKSSSKEYLYHNATFALQGSGGGLSNTKSLFNKIKHHRKKGHRVSIVPRVIENKHLENYHYFDNETKLPELIRHSTDLMNYRKDKFIDIHNQFQELLTVYN